MGIWQKILDNISMHGFHMQAVFPTKDSPRDQLFPFTYTIGLPGHRPEFGAELIVCGLPFPYCGHMVHSILEQNKLALDEPFMLEGWADYPIALKECPNADAVSKKLATGARRYADGGPLRIVQIVISDKNSLFPWQEGYSNKMDTAQPQLFKL